MINNSLISLSQRHYKIGNSSNFALVLKEKSLFLNFCRAFDRGIVNVEIKKKKLYF